MTWSVRVVIQYRQVKTVQSMSNFCFQNFIFISLIRACVANKILKWFGCVRRGCSSRNCRWGCDVPFFKWWGNSWPKYAILGTLIRSWGCLENPTRFQTIMVKIIWAFWKKSVAFGVPIADTGDYAPGVKVAYGFSYFYGRERKRKQYVLRWCLYNWKCWS